MFDSIRSVGGRRPPGGRALVAIGFAFGLCLILAAGAFAQPATGRVEGRVTAGEDGVPLAGVRARLEGTNLESLTDGDGRFRIAGVAPGEWTVVFEAPGRRTERRSVSVRAGDVVVLDVPLTAEMFELSGIVVSVTGEAQRLARTAATVGVVGGEAIRERRPAHPSELMGTVPGVWVNVTGGEGHMTAIRQPLTTDPVYLYAEDGVPTRSTGFFNHNALYEINLPQAERVEVVKGPASALYGSDAIGGVVNVETRSAASSPGLELALESGAHGWTRLLGSWALVSGDGGVRADLNLTRSDGWRESTGYDRQSATIRWDHDLGGNASLKTVASYSRIDQQTAGSSLLSEAAYRATPTRNITPISFREVDALRLSTEYERRGENTVVTVTPFVRYNRMDLLPNWSLTFDPAIWETSNRSLGVLARYRRDFEPMEARVVVGLDVDWSPGRHFERKIAPVQEDGVFVDYVEGDPIYDYDVTFLGVSPYLHAEASPVARLRLTAGLRFDRLGYDYENHLGPMDSGPHRRPESTVVRYTAFSPKLGAAFDLGGGASVFAAFSRGFRAPSEGQLFRQGVALNTIGLEPVRADNYEAGLRGVVGEWFRYELSGYWMRKTDDILTFQRPDDNRETQNAGETLHRGLEVGLGLRLPHGLAFDVAFSRGKHTYEEWRPSESVDLSGKEMESAPRTIGSTTLFYAPPFAAGASVAIVWTHLGGYWLNAENTERYDGHDLLAVRANWPITERVTVFGKASNLLDERYAESAGWSAFRGREFAPGPPRAFHAGVQLNFGGAR